MCLMQRELWWWLWSSCSSRPVIVSLCPITTDSLFVLQARRVLHSISRNVYPIDAQDSLVPATVDSSRACEERKHSYPGAGSWGCGGSRGSALGPFVGRGCGGGGSGGGCWACSPRNSAGGHGRSRNDSSELHFDFWWFDRISVR